MGSIISTEPYAMCATEPTKELDTTSLHQVANFSIKNLENLGKWNFEALFQNLLSSVSVGQFQITNSLYSFLSWCQINYPLFEEAPKDVWMKTDVEYPEDRIYGDSDTPGSPVQLSYFNAENDESEVSSKDGYPIPLEFAQTHHVSYHATDRASAEDIIEKGIKMGMGKPNQDFSHGRGFYLATDYDVAVRRANQKKQDFGNSALLIFFVRNEHFNRFEGKQLSNLSEWKTVICENRRAKKGSRPCSRYDKFDYIEGTICSNGKRVRRAHEPPQRYGRRNQQYNQICVRSDEMAKCIGDIRNIAVIFRQ